MFSGGRLSRQTRYGGGISGLWFDFCVSILGVSEGILELCCLCVVCGGVPRAVGAEVEVRGPLIGSLLPCGFLEGWTRSSCLVACTSYPPSHLTITSPILEVLFWHTTSSLIKSWIFFNYYSKMLSVWFQLIYKSEKNSSIIQSLILFVFPTCLSWFLATWVYIGKIELQRHVKIPNPSVKPGDCASSDAVCGLPAFVAIFDFSWSRKLT